MTVVNIRGTHGSGKSTIATKLIAKYLSGVDLRSTPRGYGLRLPSGQYLYVVGKYETACGGCDGIQPYSDVWPRVVTAANTHDHVLFEGALISTSYGSIGQASEYFENDFVFAFMDTPLDTCVTRVNARRAARGAEPIADTKNIEGKWTTINRLKEKLQSGQAGLPQRNVATIRHTHPTIDVLKLFGVTIRKELP